MPALLPMYVDEISPDKIKATVSNSNTVSYNLKILSHVRNPFYAHSYRGLMEDNLGEEINGVCIIPTGKFICMVVRKDDSRSMIFLDLIDKADLVVRMSEKLNPVGLRERFIQVYAEIVNHPEKHKWFELVVGSAGNTEH